MLEMNCIVGDSIVDRVKPEKHDTSSFFSLLAVRIVLSNKNSWRRMHIISNLKITYLIKKVIVSCDM